MPVTTLAVLAAAGGFLERYQAWATDDMDAAVERVGDVGFIAAYLSDDQPGHGAEVYSICRTWPVGDRAFVRRFVGPGGAGAPRRRGRTIMGWYAVRIPMYHEHVGISDDRITLWRARSAETACRLARREAWWLGGVLQQRPVGVVDVFGLDRRPSDGGVIYQRFRASPVPFGEYVDRYHDTGTELTRR
jgi:hypothetical protein